MKDEKILIKSNGQWQLEKRCWDGYEPTPGKKPYEKGSCQPVKKDDRPHPPESPEDSAHDVVEEGKDLKSEIESLSSKERKVMLEHLRQLKDKRQHRSPENAEIGKEKEDPKKTKPHTLNYKTLKSEVEVAPKDSNNKKTYLEAFGKAKDMSGEKIDSSMMINELKSIKKNVENILSIMKEDDIAPDWIKSKVTEANSHISRIADYISSLSKSLQPNEIEISEWDNGDVEVIAGPAVKEEYLDFICKSLCEKGDLVKKEWTPKKEHKSDKGGLTEAGRKSYNRATGGNLKAPQPQGGPRKRSFCARNKGQIDMHNIDCKKTPEKRACKARRRWKC